jgi:hypothetical protein
MVQNELRTRTSLLRLDPGGFLRVTSLPDVHETLVDAQETVRLGGVLQAGRRMPALVDMRRLKSQDRDARQYYASAEVARQGNASALLVASQLTKVMANLFITLQKPTIPTRIFTDEVEAIAWLKDFIE